MAPGARLRYGKRSASLCRGPLRRAGKSSARRDRSVFPKTVVDRALTTHRAASALSHEGTGSRALVHRSVYADSVVIPSPERRDRALEFGSLLPLSFRELARA